MGVGGGLLFVCFEGVLLGWFCFFLNLLLVVSWLIVLSSSCVLGLLMNDSVPSEAKCLTSSDENQIIYCTFQIFYECF